MGSNWSEEDAPIEDVVRRRLRGGRCQGASPQRKCRDAPVPDGDWMGADTRRGGATLADSRQQLQASSPSVVPPDPVDRDERPHALSPPGYLRVILNREDLLREAFQPVLKSSLCPQTGGVDRSAFAVAVARVRTHFDPSESGCRPPPLGPPYKLEEAFALFSASLHELHGRLEAATARDAREAVPRTLLLESAAAEAGEQAVNGSKLARLNGANCGGASPSRQALFQQMRAVPPRSCNSGLSVQQPLQVPPDVSPEDLGKLLEESHLRVADLHHSLSEEEVQLKQQALEIRELEQLQLKLEAMSRAKVDAVYAGSTGTPTTAPGTDSADGDELDLPMSLEDVKRHLDTSHHLRRRLQELEQLLDRKEDEVVRVSSQLRQKWQEQQQRSEHTHFQQESVAMMGQDRAWAWRAT